MSRCIRSVLIFASVSLATSANIAGYLTSGANDITQHLRIDLDVQNVTNAVSKSNLPLAYTQYSKGNNHQLLQVLSEMFPYSDFPYLFFRLHIRW